MRLFLRLFFYIVIPAALAVGTYMVMNQVLFQPLNPDSKKTVVVEISEQFTFKDIAKLLEEKQVLRFARGLQLMAKLRGVSSEIRPGEYTLSSAMSPKEILETLREGKVLEREVVVEEGSSVWKLGKEIEQTGLISAEEFNRVLTKPSLLAKAGIAAESFEGYLYPATYRFARPVSADKIVWRMLEEGEKHWPPEYSSRADQLKLSRHEIIIIASIIQKEKLRWEDAPLISSVLHNRLDQGLKLQLESALIYGLKDFSGTLTEEDLKVNSPYNTFLNFGLPIGPICNPSQAAIQAALYPEESTYLFFLKNSSGGHLFATTQKEYDEMKERFNAPQPEAE